MQEMKESLRGPIPDRTCTDVPCLVVFVICWIMWIIIGFMAVLWGDPRKLIYPTDSSGRICGSKTKYFDLSDKPYLFFFDLTACFDIDSVTRGCPTPQVCVEKCPEEYFTLMPNAHVYQGYLWTKLVNDLICIPDVDRREIQNYDDVRKFIKQDKCAWYYLDSLPVAGRCIPKAIAQGWKKIKKLATFENISTMSNATFPEKSKNGTLSKQYHRKDAGDYVSLVIEAQDVFEKMGADLQVTWWQIIFVYYNPTYVFSGIIFGVAASVYVLISCCLYKRIRLAVGLIEEASNAVSCMMSTLFFPIIPFALHFLTFIFWAGAAIFLASMRRQQCGYVGVPAEILANYTGLQLGFDRPCPCPSGEDQDVDLLMSTTTMAPLRSYCRFKSYVKPKGLVTFGQIVNFFGLLWGMFFVSGFSDVSLAGAFSSYYWARNKPDDIPPMPVVASMLRTCKFHLGSVALGSFLLATVRFIRYLLEVIEKWMKEFQKYAAVQFAMKAVKCLFWCIEQFVRFLNRNAYIMIAVYGGNFCSSARKAVELLTKNIVRVVVLNHITAYLLFIGKFVVTFISGLIAYFYFMGRIENMKDLVANLNYPYFPIIVITVAAYYVCSSFFDVYDMAVDTIFLCFLEDCERHDGSSRKPYYMSERLKRILNKENVESEKE
uniref:Choline transporter-like protein n=1 Tax=Romanomermis culicivorax TaxID=13658 RepID=A0A915K2S9_ROMCU